MELLKEIEKIHYNLKKKDYEKAISQCNILIKKFPQNSYLYNLCGLALQQHKRIQGAIPYFEKSISLDPNNIFARNNLANSFKIIGKFELCEKLYKEALSIDPKYVKCLNNYGNFKQLINDYDAAINLYEEALESDENNFMILMSLAACYHAVGNFKLAENTIQKILKLNNNIMSAHKLLSSIYDYNEPKNNSHLKNMKEISKSQDLSNEQKIDISFALAKAYEDISKYDESFKYLKIANDLKKKAVNYDIKKEENLIDSLINAFEEVDFTKLINNKGIKKIIFVCGMPRSGTTLVEQILSSHNEVEGQGELIYLQKSIKDNQFDNDLLDKKLLLEDIYSGRSKLADDYYNWLKFHKIEKDIIVDKAPQNFKWLGFIKIFFPGSKIIHCNRNAKDICTSLYKNSFASSDLDWTYSETDIAKNYNLYKKIIKFWKSKMPNDIYELNYEELVNNKEEQITKLLDFCGLKFDQQCLNHHRSKKTAIKTVSVTQARKPIYSSSINKNQFYEKNLNEMFSLLDN